MRKAAIWAEVDATMEVAKMATDLAIEACEDASACTEALATATAELHELRTENMRLRHQARETAAIHDRLAAELVTVQGSVDRLLAQCVRQRALLDEVRCCPVEHVSRKIGRAHV